VVNQIFMRLLTRKCVNPVLAKISIKTGPDRIKNGRIPGTWRHGDTGTRGKGKGGETHFCLQETQI